MKAQILIIKHESLYNTLAVLWVGTRYTDQPDADALVRILQPDLGKSEPTGWSVRESWDLDNIPVVSLHSGDTLEWARCLDSRKDER